MVKARMDVDDIVFRSVADEVVVTPVVLVVPMVGYKG